ncbi:MAG: Hsp20/alpha crystallin family protein [Pseudobdellovibrio sp.]
MKNFLAKKIFLSGLFLLLGSLSVWGMNEPKTSQSDFTRREDGQYVYYDIALDHAKPKKIEVNVKDGKILITGQLEFQNKIDGLTQGFLSNFTKSIPALGNINTSKYEIEPADGKVTLKFKKS